MMRLTFSALSLLVTLTMIKAQEQSRQNIENYGSVYGDLSYHKDPEKTLVYAEACRPSPCFNGGRCILRNIERGYVCLCGWRHSGVNCNKENDFTMIRYTIVNNVTNDTREFQYTKVISAWVADFYDIMVKAADTDSHYKFNATYYEKLGYYITEINGLKQDAKAKLYWLLVIQRGLKPWCRSAVGVSSYKPLRGDHAMFTYNTWEEVAKLPECAKYG